MADYEELRTALRWLLLTQIAPMPRYMRGRLGNGQGKVAVPGRPDFCYVRPSRSTDDVIEVFNKEVSGGDGTPVLVGELPWQPGLTQIVSVDWETYIQVGWGDGYAGVALHGPTHVWRDGFVGTDTFNVWLRQIAPMRTYPVGSGSQSVYIAPYDYIYGGSPVSWCGLPGLDLSPATPATGTARLMLTFLDMQNNVAGVVTGSIDVHSDAIELSRPALPTGSWAPSAYVRIYGGQGTISERDISDARQLWAGMTATPSGPAGGDLTGSYPNPIVRGLQGRAIRNTTPGEGYGLMYSGSAWTPIPWPGGSPTGPAGGDLTGSYPNPIVIGLQQQPISAAVPSEGEVLVFTGSMWSPQNSPWMRALSGAAYRTVWDQSDTLQSAAIISGGTITDNGDGTVAVTAGEGLIKTTNSAVGENYFMEWAADPSVAMVTGTVNWLYVDYNAGSPQVAVESVSISNIDLRTEVVLGRVWREGTTSHCLNAGQQFANYMTVACFKDFEVWGFIRASGLATTELPTRSIDVTAGVMYCAHNRITTSHSTGTFDAWYRDGGGGWTEVANQMQVDNANYDDGSGALAALTSNRYGVHWLYMDYDGDHMYIQYGQGDYTKAGAEDASIPTAPLFFQNFALLIAKITVQEGSATFESIQLPWDTQFTGASPVDHGDLAGLGDDDHPQYLLIDGTRAMTGELDADLGIALPTGQEITFDDDADTSIRGSADDVITFKISTTDKFHFNAAAIDPVTHNDIDLGSAGQSFKDLYLVGHVYLDADDDTSIRCPSPHDDIIRFRIAGTDIFEIWVTGSSYFFHGLPNGYDWALWGYDSGGDRKLMIWADPDDTVQLHYAGATRFNTSTDGILIPATLRLDFNTSGDSIRASAAGQIDLEITGTDVGYFEVDGLNLTTRMIKTDTIVPDLQSDNIAGQYFNDNDGSYPAGWVEPDAAASSNTNTYFGKWYLRGTAANTSWQYTFATGFDLENDAAADEYTSWLFGPFSWSDGRYGADLDYVIGVYGSTGGVMDANTYNRVRLHWDSGTTTWQVRGETRAGATDSETATAYNDFSFPLTEPIWIRVVIRNNANKLCRNYVGTVFLPLTHTRMSNVNETTTWGDLHLIVEMARGAGANDHLFWSLVDNSNDP